jgi:hypothetical protein
MVYLEKELDSGGIGSRLVVRDGDGDEDGIPSGSCCGR